MVLRSVESWEEEEEEEEEEGGQWEKGRDEDEGGADCLWRWGRLGHLLVEEEEGDLRITHVM